MAMNALITGASSGIGEALARIFAREGWDLVLAARRKDRLETLAGGLSSQYRIKARAVAADLSDPAAPDNLRAYIQAEGLTVDALVNNAGFGGHGRFADTAWEEEARMIQLNVVALTRLTKLFLKDMAARGRGRVLNLASTAGFQPGPMMAVYYATKAFVLSLSEALAEECRGTGVTITALCPGPTESEFQSRSRIEETKLVKSRLMGFPKASEVAEAGYRGMMAGQAVVVPGLLNKLGVQSLRLTPRAVARRMVMYMQA